MKLVLATKNPGKLKELKELALDLDWLELVLAPDDFDPEETGQTFMENSIIKSRSAWQMTGEMSLADDSGISVQALNGAPGIHSARYCEGSDADRRHKLLQTMADVPDDRRQAAFVCAMSLCSPTGEILHGSEARWEGIIAREERGNNGFGYDPIFYLPDMARTSAELTSQEKNERSHRAQAWADMLRFLSKVR